MIAGFPEALPSSMNPTARRSTYAGLFMVTLATLMYEILLTRIFSATLFYHFAFVALSIALFGMTVGAVAVYLLPHRFPAEGVHRQLAVYSVAFAISVLVSFLLHLAVPLVVGSLWSVPVAFFKYLVISVPFVFSGVVVCLALTRFPAQVSRLYAADLAGSGIGCLVLLLALWLVDAPTAVVLVGLLAAVGGRFFAAETPGPLRHAPVAFAGVCLALVAVNVGTAGPGTSLLKPRWVKLQREKPLLYERWNSFSRITVQGDRDKPSEPFGWGLSSTYPLDHEIPQLHLLIDGIAGTVLTAYDGDTAPLDYLAYDVTNLAHSIRPDSRVLVIGVGGGRDILSALYFDQKSVKGVELNGAILETVNGVFGDFTGHLDRDPRVTFENDEARAYIARHDETYDIIQASLTDTWAATASGAFVISENALYTVEAFETFLDRLAPGGLLTVSRWYWESDPSEAYRLVALAAQALRNRGIEDPREHIVLATHIWQRQPDWGVATELPEGVGASTILVGNEPFSAADLDTLERLTGKLDFQLMLSPRGSPDAVLTELIEAEDLDAYADGYPLDISPPTDNRPFFFYMLRLRDLPRIAELTSQGMNAINMVAMAVLAVLLLIVVALTGVCIVLPLWWRSGLRALRGSGSLAGFFACIGFGFMILEIAQMQRLIIFLGHPTYGLSVVLFTLLLASGLGSHSTQGTLSTSQAGVVRLALLLAMLVVVGVATPLVLRAFEDTSLLVHVLVSVGLLFPMGYFLGMAFPLGMKAAHVSAGDLTPWFWGINGATSVCASVIAVIIAINAGIAVTFWVGTAFYVLALLAYAARPTAAARAG